MDDWHDPGFAHYWDRTHLEGNPVRAEQLRLLYALVERTYVPGTTVVDLGVGSGIVAECLLDLLPECSLIGVDASDSMLALARERLARFGDRVRLCRHELTQTEDLPLPAGAASVVISVQTLHNLSNNDKGAALARAALALPPGGWLFVIDRIRVTVETLYVVYQALWEFLSAAHGSRVRRGATFSAYEEELVAKGDHPVTTSKNLSLLKTAGFQAECMHLYGDRAMFTARKA